MNCEIYNDERGLCSSCAEDVFLKQLIIEKGQEGKCTECGLPDCLVFSPADIAGHFVVLMRDRLNYVDETGERGDDLQYFVHEFLAQDLQEDFVSEIVEAITDHESQEAVLIGEVFWDALAGYKRKRIGHYKFSSHWKAAQESLKHEQRFFSDTAKTVFEDLFQNIETMEVYSDIHSFSFGRSREKETVVTTLPTGFQLYRARSANVEEDIASWIAEPLQKIGPPPVKLSRAGRMNTEGVVVLYCAEDRDTCIAELRPGLSSVQALIQLRTTKALRFLDFRKIGNASSPSLVSDFDPRFEIELSRRAFLKEIHNTISQPIAPGRESEYLITQVMTEYLAHIYKPRFDGVIFGSAQKAGGVNYVIFRNDEAMKFWGEPDEFPIEYVDGSLEFYKTETVLYSHSRQYPFKTYRGYEFVDSEFWDERDDLDEDELP